MTYYHPYDSLGYTDRYVDPVQPVVDMVDGASYIQWNDDLRCFFVWNGSLTVNIYNESFDNVDVFTCGQEVHGQYDIENHISEWISATLDEENEEDDWEYDE